MYKSVLILTGFVLPAFLAMPLWGSAQICAKQLMDFAPFHDATQKVLPSSEEQQAPLYLGRSALEQTLDSKPPARLPSIPKVLKDLARTQADVLKKSLGVARAQFEVWPVVTVDEGRLTWVFARWRIDENSPWEWLKQSDWKDKQGLTPPLLPENMNLKKKEDRDRIFQDFMKSKSLYQAPEFGNVVWTNKKGDEILAAWLHPDNASKYRRSFVQRNDFMGRLLPQPARFEDQAITFVLTSTEKQSRWNRDIEWKPLPRSLPKVKPIKEWITQWPSDFRAEYERQVRALSGADELVFPISGKRIWLRRKSSADPHNQLEELVDYLEECYQVLGIKTIRQRFMWRGIMQSNLIAVIPGSLGPEANKPVLSLAHFDTAFAEDIFKKTGRRVSVPGADDNVSATAGLLQSARVFKNLNPKHDIWHVHSTGEEFPAVDLGARHLISELLRKKQNLSGVFDMDMIGFRKSNDVIFQVNTGFRPESLKLAAITLDASKKFKHKWKATLRLRDDPKSYAYNLDQDLFDWAGYPSLGNDEHINHEENLNRKGYHDSTDEVERIDFEYAGDIVMITAETAARLASEAQ